MKQYILLAVAITGLSFQAFSQRAIAPSRTSLTRAEQSFVQDAINSNNEAMTLAQMALRQSKTTEVKQIARQVLLDHAAAQKKLYAIAHLRDSVSFGRSAYVQSSSASKLPLSDNLDSRRNKTVVSISSNNNNTPQPATRNTGTTATVAGVASNQQPTRTSNYDTSSRFGVNQTFNNNTSIDNANGTNNPVRTEIGSASGRWTENTTVINNQPVTVAAQPITSGITAPPANNDVTYGSAVVNGTVSTTNNINNTPNFPARPQDTVRMSGQSVGFQDAGTNLSFPGNNRYAGTTPNTPANTNAGSDYGVQTGVVVNNAQTNALNTAPYSNNEINANIVQTGQQQGTANPTAVVNSSTTSMNNNQVAYNNANANRANTIAVQARPVGTVVTNPAGRNVAATNSVGNSTIVSDSTSGTAPILVGRTGNRRAGGSNTSGGTPNAVTSNQNTGNAFYTNPTAITSTITTLQNTQPDAFDQQWITQMITNQQTAAQQYQAAVKATRQAQVKAYINATLPLLQGHQFALKQQQAKQ